MAGKSMLLLALLGAGLTGSLALAGGATDFDDFSEGFLGKDFTDGGVHFYDINTPTEGFYPNFGGPGDPFGPNDFVNDEFVIENSNVLQNEFPSFFSAPNTLTFGNALVNGDNLSFGRLVEAYLSTGQVENFVRFDLIYLDELVWEGIEVTLEAQRNGNVVATDEFIVTSHDPGGREIADARVMSISGVEFDTLRFYAHFGSDYTTLRGVMDNLVITPEPGTLALLGLGAVGILRRRG